MRQWVFTFLCLLAFSSAVFCGDEAYSSTITVEKVLSTDTTSVGQKLRFPDSATAMTGIVVTIPVGAETGWHTHAYSGFAYVLEGTLTVETKTGSREFTAGTSFAEMINIAHNGINNGTVPVKLVAFFSAKRGEPISTKVTK